MGQKFIICFMVLTLTIQPFLLSAGSIPMPSGRTCEGSQMPDGTYIPSGQVKEITYGGIRYRCVGCGSCTPISSGSSGSTAPYTPYIPSYGTSSQQMAIGLMGAFLSGFFGALFSSALDSDINNNAQKQKDYEEQKRRLEEEKRQQEEKKKQLLAQYNHLISQAKTQSQTGTTQSSSSFTFQTLGGQLTAFQWQSPTVNQSNNPTLGIEDKKIVTLSDLNAIFGNVIHDKVTENLVEKIDNYGSKVVEKIDDKYGKNWGSKYYERGLPIIKIVVTAKTEGAAQAGAEAIDFGISLIPMPTLTTEVGNIGRKIYTKVAFTAFDKFLTETEKACEFLGLNCDKEEFWQKTENEMNMSQKIIYNWLGGK